MNPEANGEGWQTVTFYIVAPEDDVDDVEIRLGLGIYDVDDEDALLSGYAFFDAVTIEEIDLEEYEAAVEALAAGTISSVYNRAYTIPNAPTSGDTTVDDDPETPDFTFDLSNLWWMIPTIIIGLAIIAVVIVFFIKKYSKKFIKKSDPDAPEYKENYSNVNRKKDTYNDFNE